MTVTTTMAALSALTTEEPHYDTRANTLEGVSTLASALGLSQVSTTPVAYETIVATMGAAWTLKTTRALPDDLARILACDCADALAADRPAGDTALAAAVAASRGYAAGSVTAEAMASAYHDAWMAAYDLLTPARTRAGETIWAGLNPAAPNYQNAKATLFGRWTVPLDVQWSDAERFSAWSAVASAYLPSREWMAALHAGQWAIIGGADVAAVITAWSGAN